MKIYRCDCCRYTFRYPLRPQFCPDCGKDLLQRRSRKGRVFYGCEGYPDCTRVFWNRPVNKKCPECGSLLVEKKTKNTTLECSNSECKYRE